MSRLLTSGTQSASVAPKNGPVIFAFFDFETGPLYVWNGIGTISWNGESWRGLGEFGNVSGIAETTTTDSTGPTFTLSGAPSTMIALIFDDNFNGRAVKAWIGMRDTNTDVIIADPYPVFVGRMDKVEISKDDGTTCDISVTAESKNYAPNQADDRRFNDGDQQIDFPGDTGFAYLASTGQRIIPWGVASSSGVTQGAGSGATPQNYYMP